MIAVDWGSSSLRVYRIDAGGRIMEKRTSDLGVFHCDGRFDAVLANAIEGWDDELILLSGMIGSRQGWYEVPYVTCPAGLADIASHLYPVPGQSTPALRGRCLRIVPGLRCDLPSGGVDVMRGEETQILGLSPQVDDDEHWVCLPGTHTKWVKWHEGRVQSFETSMTGELYALLCGHGSLSTVVGTVDAPFVQDAFDEGLKRSGTRGGMPHHLFGVRVAGLVKECAPGELASYLSGILIGHEIRGMFPGGREPFPSGVVNVVGSGRLRPMYVRALEKCGIALHWRNEDVAVIGMIRIASVAGFA